MNSNIVIVGSGQAGVSVAFKLRTLGYAGKLVLIGEETDPPYHRPPLSKKYITNRVGAERLYLKQQRLYEDENIDLMLGCRVQTIHRSEKKIELENGERLDYGTLVLATGARPRSIPAVQGGDAENVLTLRTLSDARRLRNELVGNKQLLVVGGGYIGLETAAVARELGLHVTLVEREARLLGRVAAAETAAYFKALHQAQGVQVLEGVGLAMLACTGGRATTAKLTDGVSLDVDVVVAGIGVIPETSLAQKAGLASPNGVSVDRAGRTADPAIYALGDCASFPYQDRMIRLESVQNAVDMADVVARAILGEPSEYACFPWFWSDQYATKLQIAGLNHGYTRVAVRKTNDASLSIWYYEEEKLIAVDAINDAKAFMTAKKWLGAGYSPDFGDIGDASLELGALSRSASKDLFI